MMILKQVVAKYLQLEEMEKKNRDKVVKYLIGISVKKTLDLMVDEMSLDDLKKNTVKDKNDFLEGELLSKFFFESFEKQLKETLYKFKKNALESV